MGCAETGPTAADFLRQTLPRLFRRGVELLRERAAQQDEGAAFELEDTLAARGFLRVVVEGEGEHGLELEGGELHVRDAPSAEGPRLTIAVPGSLLRTAMAAAGAAGADDAGADDDRTALRIARLASSRAQAVIGTRQLAFRVLVEGVPEVGEAAIRVGVGHDAPPDTPEFTVAVQHTDLQAVSEGVLDPRQLVWGGRMRFAGDYGPGLHLAMEVLQTLPPPRR